MTSQIEADVIIYKDFSGLLVNSWIFLKYNWLIGLQWKQCQTYVWYIKWSKKISKNLVLIVNWVWSLNSEMTKSLKSSPLPWYYSLVSIWSFHSPEIKMRKKIFPETPFQHSFSIGSYTVAPFFKSDFGNCCCCHLPFPVPLWNKQACHLLLLYHSSNFRDCAQ